VSRRQLSFSSVLTQPSAFVSIQRRGLSSETCADSYGLHCRWRTCAVAPLGCWLRGATWHRSWMVWPRLPAMRRRPKHYVPREQHGLAVPCPTLDRRQRIMSDIRHGDRRGWDHGHCYEPRQWHSGLLLEWQVARHSNFASGEPGERQSDFASLGCCDDRLRLGHGQFYERDLADSIADIVSHSCQFRLLD